MTADDERGPSARLEAALSALEAAVARVAGAERVRADLADTLAIMDDDRQRLASDLDAALAHAKTLEQATETVERRLDTATHRIDALLAEADGV